MLTVLMAGNSSLPHVSRMWTCWNIPSKKSNYNKQELKSKINNKKKQHVYRNSSANILLYELQITETRCQVILKRHKINVISTYLEEKRFHCRTVLKSPRFFLGMFRKEIFWLCLFFQLHSFREKLFEEVSLCFFLFDSLFTILYVSVDFSVHDLLYGVS